MKYRIYGIEDTKTLVITLDDGTEIEVYSWNKGYDGADTHYSVEIGGSVVFEE